MTGLTVVKPDFGASGGFERHLAGLVGRLAPQLDVSTVTVDAVRRPTHLGGLPVTAEMLDHHDEFFHHLGLIDRVRSLPLDDADVVLATQPPTYLAAHPRVVALFYHHPRQFYDLAEPFVASGFVAPELHERACAVVRAIETPAIGSVAAWLAGSNEVADRLRRYWDVPDDRITIHSAPPTTSPGSTTAYDPAGPVVVVGRHEWPKRAELAVAAIHATPPRRRLVVVGDGSRFEFARGLDALLGTDPARLADVTDDDLWLNRGIYTSGWQPPAAPPSGRIEWITDADDDRRDELYRAAAVVVCPAYREDYGLTVLEAMAHGRPVVVASDGGGLTEFVHHGVNGLVADPTPAALAEAIETIVDDPGRAGEMGAAGRATVEGITWQAATDDVVRAVDACRRA